MSAASFIDLAFTPLAGGIGAWLGFVALARRKDAAGETVAVRPVVVGVIVAVALLAAKLVPLLRAS
ncbi:hypothetical protein OU426_01390 [Frigidibacter sp. RF13]|uniref:hypothetical protein n=1 Tax=Frigidibacter sp. RF13 TaxID=2997340 RepID=UPI00226F59D1|nr:hypothetical protein [Frigidibacter sp. RF13]MCY1125495.1 hypothetical protein [Frigidibacter sp. RF13]